MKKYIIVLVITSFLINASAQSVIIPDANFKTYLIESFDTDGNGEISYTEAQAIHKIECTDRPLQSLDGIEIFTALEELDCSYTNHFGRGGLKQIDVSHNPLLKVLRCDNNSIDTLDVSHNTLLKELHCRNNRLRTLDISGRNELEELLCDTTINLSDCHSLRWLNCSENQLASLDAGPAIGLEHLFCNDNRLTQLNIHKNGALRQLYCGHNRLDSLDIHTNIALNDLDCGSNRLTHLDVSQNTALVDLECSINRLTGLDLTHNTKLKQLYCNAMPSLASVRLIKNNAYQTLSYRTETVTTYHVDRESSIEEIESEAMPIARQIADMDINMNPTATQVVSQQKMSTKTKKMNEVKISS